MELARLEKPRKWRCFMLETNPNQGPAKKSTKTKGRTYRVREEERQDWKAVLGNYSILEPLGTLRTERKINNQ
jgi:hypothetical protein